MTVSIKRMSAGEGYRYLMQSVATGDVPRPSAVPLTRYYTEDGTPPGRWMGAGLVGLAGDRGLTVGSIVTEEQLFRLIGMGVDPVTGEALGAAPQQAHPRPNSDESNPDTHARMSGPARQAVTGFDLTFSVPKSVSAVWAVADAKTQAAIVAAHHDAIEAALAWAEREVFASRTGKGGAQRVPVRGIVAAAFDHWDSRANDPHLHTHVVVANRAQAELGGKWRTLDSRALFRATVALSELHQGLLMDRITDALGVGWNAHTRRHSCAVQWDIVGVPDDLRAEFSQRGRNIDRVVDDLVAAYRTAHGRRPDATTVLKLRQQATLSTRPEKQLRPLRQLTDEWRQRALPYVGSDAASWAHALPRSRCAVETSASITAEQIRQLAERTLAAVADKRATFTRWNLYAEAQRQLHAVRFATPADRQLVGDRVTDAALGLAVLITAAELEQMPPDRLRHASGDRYTTQQILDAEDRLLDASRDTSGPRATGAAVEASSGAALHLGDDQRAVVARIATSGRQLDLLVGAAGTGKTAAMAGLAAVWQGSHGMGSVIGLAPSAAAADILGAELQLPAENTAKWLTEAALEPKRRTRLADLSDVLERLPAGTPQWHRVRAAVDALSRDVSRWRLRANQLVIIDEASLAGTITLDRIVSHARAAGAKVLLVGDSAQLSSVQAGGAFAMLARDRGDAPELIDVRRFTAEWERQASLALRRGDPAALDAYEAHGRIHEGTPDSALDRAYSAWLTDHLAGKRSLLIAADAATVSHLNARARADLVAIGQVPMQGVRLADGTLAGRGDLIVTRRNDRALTIGHRWVKNGDEWTVVGEVRGSLIVQPMMGRKALTLPAEYVRDHVELAYATTAYRAQGRTVDTAHTVITGPQAMREVLYVAATRGRHANHLYVVAERIRDIESAKDVDRYASAREILDAVINNTGTELSAHQSAGCARAAAATPIGRCTTTIDVAELPGTRALPSRHTYRPLAAAPTEHAPHSTLDR